MGAMPVCVERVTGKLSISAGRRLVLVTRQVIFSVEEPTPGGGKSRSLF